MHPVTKLFLSGILCTLGFEESIMKALSSDSTSFNWAESRAILVGIVNDTEDQKLINRFDTLEGCYRKIMKKDS
jgi:hypothetical protein